MHGEYKGLTTKNHGNKDKKSSFYSTPVELEILMYEYEEYEHIFFWGKK